MGLAMGRGVLGGEILGRWMGWGIRSGMLEMIAGNVKTYHVQSWTAAHACSLVHIDLKSQIYTLRSNHDDNIVYVTHEQGQNDTRRST